MCVDSYFYLSYLPMLRCPTSYVFLLDNIYRDLTSEVLSSPPLWQGHKEVVRVTGPLQLIVFLIWTRASQLVYILISVDHQTPSDSLRTRLGDMGGHIDALEFPDGSSHSEIREAVWRAVSQMVILVARILEDLIEVPGRPHRGPNDGTIHLAILEPEESASRQQRVTDGMRGTAKDGPD